MCGVNGTLPVKLDVLRQQLRPRSGCEIRRSTSWISRVSPCSGRVSSPPARNVPAQSPTLTPTALLTSPHGDLRTKARPSLCVQARGGWWCFLNDDNPKMAPALTQSSSTTPSGLRGHNCANSRYFPSARVALAMGPVHHMLKVLEQTAQLLCICGGGGRIERYAPPVAWITWRVTAAGPPAQRGASSNNKRHLC